MSLSMILGLGQTALELALFNALTVLALFLSYSMLNVCDLSTDGCFTLGAAVGAVVAIAGHPWLSIPAAMGAGMLSGFVTATLQTRMGVNSLLAGIIVNTGLYSVNIWIMGGSSLLNMNKTDTVFTMLKDALKGTFLGQQYSLVIGLVAVTAVILFLSLFLRTRLGLAIRATGDNPDMVRSSSINPVFTTTVGLCISNSFTALSGCLLAQSQKSVDVNIGSGMVTVALASLLIGGVFMGRRSIPLRAVGAVIGAFVFRLVYTVALRFNLPAFMLKLISSVIVVIAISGPYLKGRLPLTQDARVALDDVTLRVRNGDFISIIGANGAGKSTLFNAICGSFYVDKGAVILDGEDVTMLPEYKRARTIGRLFQDPMRGSAPGMSIEENLVLAAGQGGWLSTAGKKEKQAFRDRLALLDMGLEDRMKQPVGLLSGGQRQALTLMMATLSKPKLLLLDEHTAALDPGTAEKVLNLTMKIVSENHLTCLMITHNMQSALELGNRTMMMDAGRIVFDTTGEERALLTVNDLLEKFHEASGRKLDNDRMLLV